MNAKEALEKIKSLAHDYLIEGDIKEGNELMAAADTLQSELLKRDALIDDVREYVSHDEGTKDQYGKGRFVTKFYVKEILSKHQGSEGSGENG
ncbi:hypothetical protein OAF54_01140 [bacterium]|nr:hypothetical protein [bacterium]